jgi:hypothetical protein
VGFLPGLQVEAIPLLRPRKVRNFALFRKWYFREPVCSFSNGITESHKSQSTLYGLEKRKLMER